MSFDREQKGIIVRSALAILATLVALAAAYLWLPAALFGLSENMAAGDRIAFALKLNLPVFLWLAWCLRRVASGRFHVAADRRGSAYGEPTPALAVRIAILQNSLEQAVLFFGTSLSLAAVSRGSELAILPVLVLLFLLGRLAFALSYPRGAVARSFGMALTAAPILANVILAIALLIPGR